jgi:hypothetical protein
MKKTFCAVSLCFLFLSFGTVAEQREDFKCYVETTQGHKLLRFSWLPSKTKNYMAKFVGKRVSHSGQGNSVPLYIKTMLECVKSQQSFNKPEAREVEEMTLS